MDFQTQKQVVSDFLSRVNMSADRVLELSDQIQNRAKAHPELTAACQFGRSMQVRRLLSVRPQSWNQTDYSNAQEIVISIESHLKHKDEEAHALALAVLGVETTSLDAALRALELKLTSDSELTISQEVDQTTLPEGQSGMNGDSSNDNANQNNTSRSKGASGKRRRRKQAD